MHTTRILLMGCGGIGGTMAARLTPRGHQLAIVTHNHDIAAAVNSKGLVLRDEERSEQIDCRATPTIPNDLPGAFDFVFLATQPTQVEEAARAALPFLAADGALVCFQNGLCEQRVAAIAGSGRVIGAIVAWGASMLEPGVYERTSEGGFTIGRLDGSVDTRVDTLRAVLTAIGPVQVTRNLRGARWSKLAINCAISTLGTIGGDRLGALMKYRLVRRLGLEIMTEAVQVARARDVQLEKVAGTIDLDWVTLSDEERYLQGSPSLLAKHALLLAVGAKYRRLRSSMLIAIERGREPAIDFLNGEVVRRAGEHGIAVPVNTRAQELIRTIADRHTRPGLPLLKRLYEETAVVRALPHRWISSGPSAPSAGAGLS